MFNRTAVGGVVNSTPPAALSSMIQKIAELDEGFDISVDILGQRFHADHLA